MLNDSLYFKLKKIFKEVKVSSQGVPFIYRNKYDVLTGKNTVEISQRGETYCVCCPYCKVVGAVRNDSKFRLWINHRWGTKITNFNTYSLAICYNENCLSNKFIRDSFINLIESTKSPIILDTQNTATHLGNNPQTAIELPNGSIPISELNAGHPARLFLESRKFDPDYLYKVYDIRYIEFSFERPALNNSILIPIYQDKKLVAWQCRKLDAGNGKSKYITSPGAKISKILYNWDNSAGYEYAIIVEGVFDVWRLGPPAMCVFGTHLSLEQFRKLSSRYSFLFVMFDGDAQNKILTLCRRHSSEIRMIPVLLDRQKDPADYNTNELQTLLADALEKNYGECSFTEIPGAHGKLET